MRSNYWNSYWRRQLSRRTVLGGAATVAVGAGAAGLIGCGDDDDGNGGDPTATPGNGGGGDPTATPGNGGGVDYPAPPSYSDLDAQSLLGEYHWSKVAPQTQVLGTPRMGGVLALAAASFGLQSLSPTEEVVGQWPFCYTHNNLLGMDFRHESGEVDTQAITTRNSVSESWEQPDDTTYTFTLRNGVTWHDVDPANGEALTLEDIRDTYELFKTSPFHGNRFADIQSIEEPEPGIIQVKTSQPASQMIAILRIPAFGILNAKHIAEGADALAEKAIGTGPFVQGKFIPNQVRAYERNPNYWLQDELGNTLPYLDGVVQQVIPDPAATVAAFRAGQVDVYKPTSPEEFERLIDELDTHAQTQVGFCGCSSPSIFFSHRTPEFADVRVRRALSLAVDRQDMIDTIWGGAATMRSFIPWMWLGRPWPKTIEEMGEWNRFDPTAARAMLDDAGIEDLTLTMHFTGQVLPGTSQPTGDARVESVVRDLGEIGININLEPYDVLSSGRNFFAGEWDGMFSRGAGASTALNSDDYLQFLTPGSGLNGSGVDDSTLNGMLEEIRGVFDVEGQEEINNQINTYVSEDQILHGLAMPDTFAFTTWRKYLHNVIDAPSWWITGGGGQGVTSAWLDEDAPQRQISDY